MSDSNTPRESDGEFGLGRVLRAGSFSQPPVSIQYVRGGRIMILGADRQNCWTDSENRLLLDSVEELVKVANAHGYVFVEGTFVKVEPELATPKASRKPRAKKVKSDG